MMTITLRYIKRSGQSMNRNLNLVNYAKKAPSIFYIFYYYYYYYYYYYSRLALSRNEK